MKYMVILLFSMVLTKSGKAQILSITGKVTDEGGRPVPFASIWASRGSLPCMGR